MIRKTSKNSFAVSQGHKHHVKHIELTDLKIQYQCTLGILGARNKGDGRAKLVLQNLFLDFNWGTLMLWPTYSAWSPSQWLWPAVVAQHYPPGDACPGCYLVKIDIWSIMFTWKEMLSLTKSTTQRIRDYNCLPYVLILLMIDRYI